MLKRGKLAIGQLFNNPNNVRTILILGTILIAAIAGGAPNDYGG